MDADQTIPQPFPDFDGRRTDTKPSDAARRASWWTPKGATLEKPLCTFSRYSLRLVDQQTGRAYTANELIAMFVDGGGVIVVDSLDSTSATSALSSKQGKVLNDTKAPKDTPSFTGSVTITGTANGGSPNVNLDGSILPGTNFRGAPFSNSGELSSNSIVRTMVDTRVPLAVSRDSVPTGGVSDYKTVWVYPSRNTLNLDTLLFGVYSYDGEVNGKPSFRKDAFTSIYWDGVDSWLVEGLTRTWKKTGEDLHVGGSWVLIVGSAVVGGNIQLYFDTLKAGQVVQDPEGVSLALPDGTFTDLLVTGIKRDEDGLAILANSEGGKELALWNADQGIYQVIRIAGAAGSEYLTFSILP